MSFCESARFDADTCQTAALLTSELVTNALLYGKGRATLHLQAPPPCLRVAVEDHNPQLPAVGECPALSATSGRGLHIVSVLASHWGIEQTDNGKPSGSNSNSHYVKKRRIPRSESALPGRLRLLVSAQAAVRGSGARDIAGRPPPGGATAARP